MPDPYQSDMPPFNGTDPLQSLSAGELTPEHNGHRVYLNNGMPVYVLLESIPLQGGYVKMMMSYRGMVSPFIVSKDTPVVIDPPREVTGD